MDPTRKLIFIEFNELSASLLDKFMAAGELPNFKRFYDASTVYTTTAGDDPLEPWVQWPTVHCGVPYREHRALYLGDGARITQKAMGTVLSENGIPVGIFGMMNGNYDRPNGYHVPDPWDAVHEPHPSELRIFFDFVARQVQENTRGLQLSLRETIAFASFMLRHGLSVSTVVAAVRQLLGERLRPGTTWKRAAILDLLQYDVFRYLNRKHRVRFASFFSNSTAHLQHYFWRNMAPEGFEEPPAADADESLRHAVRFGYRSMDRLLGRMMNDYPDHRLVICTGLSQAPWFETTKCTYRPIDFAAFLHFAGVSEDVRVIPVMAEKFRVECDSESVASAVDDALARLRFRGAALMQSHVANTTVYAGCNVIDADSTLLPEQVVCGAKSVAFGELLYRITAMNSGRHVPEGLLWVRDGEHRVNASPLPLAAVAPMILKHFAVEAPSTMQVESPYRRIDNAAVAVATSSNRPYGDSVCA
jgi:hypothetical protein